MAHLYWDTLPDNDSTKIKLMELFKDHPQGAVEGAILSIGRAANKLSEMKMSEEQKQGFMRLLRVFWNKVKLNSIKAFNYIANQNEFQSITFAEDMLFADPEKHANKSYYAKSVEFMKRDLDVMNLKTAMEDFFTKAGVDMYSTTAEELENIFKLNDDFAPKKIHGVTNPDELTFFERAMLTGTEGYVYEDFRGLGKKEIRPLNHTDKEEWAEFKKLMK